MQFSNVSKNDFFERMKQYRTMISVCRIFAAQCIFFWNIRKIRKKYREKYNDTLFIN